MSLVIPFAGSPIDRADHLRIDDAALERLKGEGARLLHMDGLNPEFGEDGSGLVWGPVADVQDGTELVFLGTLDGRGCFAPVPASASAGPADFRLFQSTAVLSDAELAIYGTARALVGWHARHRFCAQCGAPTLLAKGGWQRNCTSPACKAEHFPRTDPVTIMLVEHEGRVLLGRQPRFPPRRFSALAGFVEPGESLEEAVAREVFEEAGVRVRDVTYVASQPWPFPSTLMIGCHAHADDPDVTIDMNELEEVEWFTRDEIAAAMAGDESGRIISPPSLAIAHHLLKWWLER